MVTWIPRKEHFLSHVKATPIHTWNKNQNSSTQEEVLNAALLQLGAFRNLGGPYQLRKPFSESECLYKPEKGLSTETRIAENPSITSIFKNYPNMFMGLRRKGIHPQGMIWRKTHSSQNYLSYQAYPRAKILSCVYRWFHLTYKNKHMCLLEGKHPLRPMIISYMASALGLLAPVGSQEMELRRGRGWEEGKMNSGLERLSGEGRVRETHDDQTRHGASTLLT